MEKHTLPDSSIVKIGQTARPELALRIARREVVTSIVLITELPYYLEAALATNFKVEQIARAGEYYPSIQGIDFREQEVRDTKLLGAASVAVSIEGPEGMDHRHHDLFWERLEGMLRKKV